MLTRKLRKQIEWHFYNHRAELALLNERREEIAAHIQSVDYSSIGGGSKYNGADSTAKRADQLLSLDALLENKRNWFCVVRNTFLHFRLELEFDVMCKLYIENKIDTSHRKIIRLLEIESSTFYFWRDKWLERALRWAKELDLL